MSEQNSRTRRIGGEQTNAAVLRNRVAARAAFSTQTGATIRFARLFVVFATTHFFLDSTPLHKFAEPANSLLNALTISKNQLNHVLSSFHILNF